VDGIRSALLPGVKRPATTNNLLQNLNPTLPPTTTSASKITLLNGNSDFFVKVSTGSKRNFLSFHSLP